VAYDDAAHTEGNKLVGNVLTDPGLGGAIDFVSQTAVVAAFYYNGALYAIVPPATYREITTNDGGTLRVERDGDYSYTPAPGHSLSGVMDHFEYVVNDGNKGDIATVYLYSDDMRTNGTVGDDLIDQNGTVMPGMISGGAGDDLILGGAGDSILDGGAGSDVLAPASLSEDDAAAIRADLLADGVISDQDAQAIANLLDTLPDGRDGDYLMYGGAGNDALLGGSGNDTLHGGAGDDFLFGGKGNDSIYGGGGNDSIYGGSGNDVLSGGSGDDIFVWKAGDIGANENGTPFHDIIVDFSMQGTGIVDGLFGNDKIDLSDLLPNNAKVEDHVSITRNDDGKSAILSISSVANGGDVIQTIELQGVYETHATGGTTYEEVNAMIMQNIITNNG
jgi:Ca2+-binding RTX toxin-like protein